MTGASLIELMRDVVVPVVVFFVLPVFLWYQRDRRKSKAESAVAERTVGFDVTVKETGGLGASVAFVQEAFKLERESYVREIGGLRDKVAALEASEEEKDRKIKALEDAEIEKDRVIHDLTRSVRELTARLERLEGEKIQ